MNTAFFPVSQRGVRWFACAGLALFLALGLALALPQAGFAAEAKAPTAEAPAADAYAKDADEAQAGETKVPLFGTVEIRRPLKTLPAWLSVLERNAVNSIFEPGSRLNTSTTWEELKAKAKGLSKLDQVKLVNSFWNRWPYREDREVYGKPDYWAIPSEFRKNSGDCEDYSIAKYFTLRALGFPIDQLRIVVVMETIRNIAHAVLVVYLDGEAYVLDNLSTNVLPHSRLRNYVPQYSVNEEYRWAHMRPKKKAAAKKAPAKKK